MCGDVAKHDDICSREFDGSLGGCGKGDVFGNGDATVGVYHFDGAEMFFIEKLGA